MATQKRSYVLLLNDPNGERALGPYTKHEARAIQIANTGARIVTAEQLNQLRARKLKPLSARTSPTRCGNRSR